MPPGILLRKRREGEDLLGFPSPGSLKEYSSSPEEEEKTDKSIICAACGSLVTHKKYISSYAGSFEHVFTNPNGYVFRIGLFTYAEGVVPAGMWIGEFSWFPHTLWRLVVCGGCFVHLGWEYIYADSTEEGEPEGD
ncbi:MAG: cereblon family protein [Spirochaetia bacterium]